MILMEMDRIR